MNPHDVEACARDALTHVEAAVSLSDPGRCQAYVTDEVARSIRGEVKALGSRVRRRVYGNFEILSARVARGDPPGRVAVRIVEEKDCESDEHEAALMYVAATDGIHPAAP